MAIGKKPTRIKIKKPTAKSNGFGVTHSIRSPNVQKKKTLISFLTKKRERDKR